MKKMMLLGGLALALTACGATTSGTIAEPEMGTLSLSLYKTDGLQAQDVFSNKTTNVRVRISNPTNGFNVVRDVAVNAAGDVSVQVPAASGYVVEAISYRAISPLTYYKEGVKTDITAVPNTTTQVNLTLTRPNFKVTVPASVVSGQPFKLTVSGVPAGFTLCEVAATNTPRTANQYNIGAPSISKGNGELTLNAPEANAGGKMYVYVVCFRDLSSSTPWYVADGVNFVDAFLPDIDAGEAAITSTLTSTPTTINIGIGY